MVVEVGVFKGPRWVALAVKNMPRSLSERSLPDEPQPPQKAHRGLACLCVCVRSHKAVLCNYVVIPKYAILAAVRVHAYTQALSLLLAVMLLPKLKY